tara:strand:+ start:650 stop:985 length:336 start_codon:yes stop_codon:yes gene_type:complete
MTTRDWIIPTLCPTKVAMSAIVDETSRAFGVPIEAMRSSSRSQEIAHARQMAMHIAYIKGKRSYSQIGRFFGRDHTTVIHAIRAVDARRAADPDLDAAARILESRIAGASA